MQRWLAIAGLAPLLVAAAANGEPTRLGLAGKAAAPKLHAPIVDFRLTQEPALNRFDPPSSAIGAQTQVSPNAQIGLRLINVGRPRLGPELRTDGRASRSRRPAVSFTFRF